jgi:hypothetical protein
MVPDSRSDEYLNGGRRTHIRFQLRSNLQQFPEVEIVRYVNTRAGIDRQLRADFNCTILMNGELGVDEASFYVNWWTHSDGPDQFKFHYRDSSGYYCEWHRQENDHVEGLDHFQWRTSSEEDYRYETVEFDYDQPPGILWEIRERLEEHLSDRI